MSNLVSLDFINRYNNNDDNNNILIKDKMKITDLYGSLSYIGYFSKNNLCLLKSRKIEDILLNYKYNKNILWKIRNGSIDYLLNLNNIEIILFKNFNNLIYQNQNRMNNNCNIFNVHSRELTYIRPPGRTTLSYCTRIDVNQYSPEQSIEDSTSANIVCSESKTVKEFSPSDESFIIPRHNENTQCCNRIVVNKKRKLDDTFNFTKKDKDDIYPKGKRFKSTIFDRNIYLPLENSCTLENEISSHSINNIDIIIDLEKEQEKDKMEITEEYSFWSEPIVEPVFINEDSTNNFLYKNSHVRNSEKIDNISVLSSNDDGDNGDDDDDDDCESIQEEESSNNPTFEVGTSSMMDKKNKKRKNKKKNTGYIYIFDILKTDEDHLYTDENKLKIGKTTDFDSRRRHYKNDTLLYRIKTVNCHILEKILLLKLRKMKEFRLYHLGLETFFGNPNTMKNITKDIHSFFEKNYKKYKNKNHQEWLNLYSCEQRQKDLSEFL